MGHGGAGGGGGGGQERKDGVLSFSPSLWPVVPLFGTSADIFMMSFVFRSAGNRK